MRRFQYLLGTLIFLAIGVLLGWSIPRSVENRELRTENRVDVAREVNLMIDEGDGTVKTFERLPFTEGESLFDLTKHVAESEAMKFDYDPPGEFGIMITEIDGKKNGAGGAYWLYYIDNHMGDVASDQYKLKPGDIIEWKFVKLKF